MTDYALRLRPAIMSHGRSQSLPAWLGDYDASADDRDSREYTYIDAQAASGDWFITLATRLDKIAQGLAQDSAEQIEIEHLVTSLFYLQDHWKLTSKDRND